MFSGFDLKKHLIFMTKTGSHAYGTSTPTSDLDVRGVTTAPLDFYLGILNRFAETADFDVRDLIPGAPESNDASVMEFLKYVKLASDGNPNVIELLFIPEQHWLYQTPHWHQLHDRRHLFLSKKCRHTFSGYAHAQLKRIRTHRSWLLNPPKAKPERKDFDLPETSTLSSDQFGAAVSLVDRVYQGWAVSPDEEIPQNVLNRIRQAVIDMIAELKADEDQVFRAAARRAGLDDNLIEIVSREKRYRAASSHWKQYQEWKKTRNAARSELEIKFGYDCYLDDTEFLTSAGWKKYDDIPNDLELATLNQSTGQIEFQLPLDRVCKEYSGPIYFVETADTACAVTPNHRMWVSEVKGGKSNSQGRNYNEERSQWKIEKAYDLLHGKRYSFHVRTAVEGGHLHRTKQELIIANRSLAKKVVGWCGEGSSNKRLPGWVYTLDSDSARYLLKVLVAGDGTERKYSDVYYTVSKQLAGDVQALALVAGFTSKVLGPYPNRDDLPLYHVYIGKRKKTSRVITKGALSHFFVDKVRDRKIVCFTVPNEVLITRRNGKVAIQGNTKHGMHLVRLYRMGLEILETGDLIVDRRGLDADELLAIRNGLWSFEKIEEFADEMDSKIESAYATSKLKNSSDKKEIDKICMRVLPPATNTELMNFVKKFLASDSGFYGTLLREASELVSRFVGEELL